MKYYVYLILFALLLLIVGIVVVSPIFFPPSDSLYHVYARLFIVIFVVNTFAILRMYNAIVNNTRFLIKMRETLVPVHKLLSTVIKVVMEGSKSVRGAKQSVDNLVDSIGQKNAKTEKEGRN